MYLHNDIVCCEFKFDKTIICIFVVWCFFYSLKIKKITFHVTMTYLLHYCNCSIKIWQLNPVVMETYLTFKDVKVNDTSWNAKCEWCQFTFEPVFRICTYLSKISHAEFLKWTCPPLELISICFWNIKIIILN